MTRKDQFDRRALALQPLRNVEFLRVFDNLVLIHLLCSAVVKQLSIYAAPELVSKRRLMRYPMQAHGDKPLRHIAIGSSLRITGYLRFATQLVNSSVCTLSTAPYQQRHLVQKSTSPFGALALRPGDAEHFGHHCAPWRAYHP